MTTSNWYCLILWDLLFRLHFILWSFGWKHYIFLSGIVCKKRHRLQSWSCGESLLWRTNHANWMAPHTVWCAGRLQRQWLRWRRPPQLCYQESSCRRKQWWFYPLAKSQLAVFSILSNLILYCRSILLRETRAWSHQIWFQCICRWDIET